MNGAVSTGCSCLELDGSNANARRSIGMNYGKFSSITLT
jgi:hypothetical protein